MNPLCRVSPAPGAGAGVCAEGTGTQLCVTLTAGFSKTTGYQLVPGVPARGFGPASLADPQLAVALSFCNSDPGSSLQQR